MEHKHESNGGMKSRANIALIVFLAIAAFGDEYRRYMVMTPAFIPGFGGSRSAAR